MKVGVVYRVKMMDCCVSGEFTATVVKIVVASHPDVIGDDSTHEVQEYGAEMFLDSMFFDNGVVLTEINGVEFEDASNESFDGG